VTEPVAIVVLATLLFATLQLLQRPAPQRRSVGRRAAPRPDDAQEGRAESPSVDAARVAWASLLAATLGFLGHLAAPAADVLWWALVAAAIASIPSALALPRLRALRNGRRPRRRGRYH
jgi:hypothetical protein